MYAVIDTENVVWGTGPTEEEAWTDASYWLAQAVPEEPAHRSGEALAEAAQRLGYELLPATPAAYHAIEEHGYTDGVHTVAHTPGPYSQRVVCLACEADYIRSGELRVSY